MRKFLKIVGILLLILLAAVLLLVGFIAYYNKEILPNGSNRYYEKLATGGEIEAAYLAPGEYEVGYFEQGVLENYEKYEIYYPAEMEEPENADKKYPVIVSLNGTGTKASSYPEWFRHMASYGFIVIGTEEEYSWNSFAADMSVQFLLRAAENEDSIFYRHIDTENIGAVGHSQGGAGVINAVSNSKYQDVYKTAVSLSPTMETLAAALEWDYDVSKVSVPLLLLSSTGSGDENLVVSLAGLQSLYDSASSPFKVMARRNDCDHGGMLFYADGYVTAWFMWQLQGDEEAAKAFTGDSPEITRNTYYQDVQSE